MKKILIALAIVSGLTLAGCDNPAINIPADDATWQRFTGSTGIGFWGFGSPDDPVVLLVFIRTSYTQRIEFWQGGELLRRAEWLNSNTETITYRAPNGQIFTQRFILLDNGLDIEGSGAGLAPAGGLFWRRERPSWWSWEFGDSWPNLTGSSHNFVDSNGIGFWGARGDPGNPDYVLVFINTPYVSRVEIWVNQQFHNWGHWIDATRDTIIYRQPSRINPATQRYLIENNSLWLQSHFAAIAGGGPWLRFEQPEWWVLEERDGVSPIRLEKYACPQRIIYVTEDL